MTSFEKTMLIQVGVAGIVGALFLIFGTEEARFSMIAVCIAWSGAVLMWTQVSDRNGKPKHILDCASSQPILFIFPIACAMGAVLFMSLVALPVIAIAYLIGLL